MLAESVILIPQDMYAWSQATLQTIIGITVYLFHWDLYCKNVVFTDNGADLYVDQGSTSTFDDGETVAFIKNSAVEHGGAIHIYLVHAGYSSLLLLLLWGG